MSASAHSKPGSKPELWTQIRQIDSTRLMRANAELWLVLSLFILALVLNQLIASHRMVLGLYSLPTLLSAYVYGRRHAVLTAFASIFMVGLVVYFSPSIMTATPGVLQLEEKWFDITVWGGILVVTAYFMGTLHERQKAHMRELEDTYHGVLMILQQFITKDKYTQNHSYRVSIYAAKIAAYYGLPQSRIEDIRAAALLHDIGKLEISREVLYKAAKLTKEEFDEVKTHVTRGVDLLQPVGGTLRRVLPIILAHHDRHDGNGYRPLKGEEIPIESRILAVADSYDAITSDRPYRKASTTYEAKQIIQGLSGKDFDPQVVEAFVLAFDRRELEIPEVVI
ncbi:MAG: HD-GYP domain-containing protein [Acidobacteriales bacterium]|nr:HD-GYP domain-containing protein [Terriglobales bacterium]